LFPYKPEFADNPKYWGAWFWRIGDGTVRETDLNVFFQFGMALEQFSERLSVQETAASLAPYIIPALDWTNAFLIQTDVFPLKDSRDAVREMRCLLSSVFTSLQTGKDRAISQSEVRDFYRWKQHFEECFDREHRNLRVFTVTPKGIYDTRLLAEKTEEKFPASIRQHFPEQMIYDLRQSGRCLAFEVPTAAAFHVFRATESLIRQYYEVLAKQPWRFDTRDMGSYIRELNKLPGVNADVTRRLGEIKDFERNPSIHPEQIVSLEKAPILFELCSGVIYAMAVEIGKLT
jgi:hypothetical protein